MTLALFDFDGTITCKDSLLPFTAFAKGKLKFYTGLICLAPLLLMNKLGMVGAQKTKNIFITWFFKGESTGVFNDISTRYASGKIDAIVLKTAVEKINWHLQNGHRVIVVSASPEDYVQKWCGTMNIKCIATRLQKLDDKLTGKIDGLNCKGAEKVRRILAEVSLADYQEIYGYGNSSGDKEMLEMCTKQFYKVFQ